MVVSGFEIGISLRYRLAQSLKTSAMLKKPHPNCVPAIQSTRERPTWDLTSVLQGVRPDRGYFDLSALGVIKVHDDGYTEFLPQKMEPANLHS